jgi:hypothetical protein
VWINVWMIKKLLKCFASRCYYRRIKNEPLQFLQENKPSFRNIRQHYSIRFSAKHFSVSTFFSQQRLLFLFVENICRRAHAHAAAWRECLSCSREIVEDGDVNFKFLLRGYTQTSIAKQVYFPQHNTLLSTQ